MEKALLTTEHLRVGYGGEAAVHDVSFCLRAGETLAIAGESGCGKTTLLKALMGVGGAQITGGRAVFDGNDLAAMRPNARRGLAGGQISMIFQDPGAAFNPIRSYDSQFRELLRSRGRFRGAASRSEIRRCFASLGLSDGARILKSCPCELSGGMNQRAAVAAAMLLGPRLLLLDEPTSALDVTAQQAVVDELMRLRSLTGLSMLLVTHNLGLAAAMADRTGVMYAGRLVELGATADVLERPCHPYTKCLLRAVPALGGGLPQGLGGSPPAPGAPARGCAFFARCPAAAPGCRERETALREISPGHFAACAEGRP